MTPEIENDKPDADEKMKWRRLDAGTAAWGLEEKRTAPSQRSADNQPQTLDDFEQLISDATTEFAQNKSTELIANRTRHVLKKTMKAER